MTRHLFAIALTALLAVPAVVTLPAMADSLYVDGPNDNLTGFVRPYLGVGNLVTILVSENNLAEAGASTNRSKDSRVRGDWNFGALLPNVAAGGADLRGRDDFNGQGTTRRNGRLVTEISARIEEVLPNGTLRVVGTKTIRVNDEVTEIIVRGFIRPLDLTTDNVIESARVADMQIDFKGTGPASAKATPGILTRIFNWLF